MGSWRRALSGLHRILNSSTALNQASVAPLSAAPTDSFLRPQYLGFSVSHYSAGSESDYEIDFSNEESKRRLFNRLMYRSKQRGFLELDLVLGKWVEENIHSMDKNGIKSLVDVLDLENPDLWKWLSGQDQPPDAVSKNPVFAAVRERISNNLKIASPETRAVPGQPWVRGWDDMKKNPGSPVAGNQ